MLPHALKTSTIDVKELVGLLISTKSYSLSKKSAVGNKASKQAGYLETSRMVDAGAQGIPFERLRFSPSEIAASSQLVLATVRTEISCGPKGEKLAWWQLQKRSNLFLRECTSQ